VKLVAHLRVPVGAKVFECKDGYSAKKLPAYCRGFCESQGYSCVCGQEGGDDLPYQVSGSYPVFSTDIDEHWHVCGTKEVDWVVAQQPTGDFAVTLGGMDGSQIESFKNACPLLPVPNAEHGFCEHLRNRGTEQPFRNELLDW
jgi:hypothetical protein